MVMQRAEGAIEYLDRPVPRADREASLNDIDRLNAWFGGYWLTLREVRRLAGAAAAGPALLVVDVGGGRGDFAHRLIDWARRGGRAVRVVVVDRECAGDGAGILRVRADATALPFREGAADVVTASLTLHHLEPDAAVASLREMRATARGAVVVNDLLRSRLTLGLVWLVTRLFCRHRFSRHDGPLSVRRAYAAEELRVLADKAGLARVAIRRYPWLGRIVAVLA